MNKTTDESGNTVLAVGTPDSPARMKIKYFSQLFNQIEFYKKQVEDGVKEPVIEFVGPFEDHWNFNTAVKYYVKFPLDF